jgi:hypothetical protein
MQWHLHAVLGIGIGIGIGIGLDIAGRLTGRPGAHAMTARP